LELKIEVFIVRGEREGGSLSAICVYRSEEVVLWISCHFLWIKFIYVDKSKSL